MSASAADAPRLDVVERAREILADPTYQTDLPDEGASFEVPLGFLGAGVEVFFWVAIVVVVVLLVAWAIGKIRSQGPEAGHGARGPLAPSDGRDPLTADASDRLAAEGRYAEAVHGLLQVAIRGETLRLDRPPKKSATSRELLRFLPFEPVRREAFRCLVDRVERSLFGGEPVSEGQYRMCRSSFDELTGDAL